MIQPFLTLFTVFYLYLSRKAVHAALNYTVDSTGSAFNYLGSGWSQGAFPQDFGGSHQIVDLGPNGGGQTTAYATFKFTGICS
jgi:hypothetical protein